MSDLDSQYIEHGMKVPATGNRLKPGTNHDQWLSVTAGPSHNLDDDEPEVHLLFEGCCGDFAQGWFLVSDLEAAIAAARDEEDR